jgi:hypothetical protein
MTEESLNRMGVSVGNAAKIMRRLKVSKQTPKQTNTEPPESTSPQNADQPEDERKINAVRKKMEKAKGWHELPPDQQRAKARNLVINEALLRNYFDTKYIATRKLAMDITESSDGDIEEKQEMKKIIEQIDEVENESYTTNDMKEDKKRMSFSAAEIIQMGKIARKTQLQVGTEEFLKIKLVIVEIHNTASTRTMRRMLTPLMDTFGLGPQFGMFHSALVVGPWYLEWNDSSLCVPRKCYAGAAVLAADVDKFYKGPQVRTALSIISKIVCEWNSTKQYSQHNTNCQHFIDELCKALEIKLEFKGALGTFIEQLRKTGQCDLRYTLTEELQKQLGVDYNSRQFNTHKELDEFVTQVRMVNPTYFDIDPVGKDDWILLKSYDRAFWLRHFKDLTDGNHQPHECPFLNPTVSGSLAPNFFTYKRSIKK